MVASEVDILENIVNASGKFGGVAGVLAGVINCKGNPFINMHSFYMALILLTENPALFLGIAASWK